MEEWEKVNDFLTGILRFTENEIVGEALIALLHDDLKSMGINSVGHRLTILKSVYDVKKAQDVEIESDHYVPLCTFSQTPGPALPCCSHLGRPLTNFLSSPNSRRSRSPVLQRHAKRHQAARRAAAPPR